MAKGQWSVEKARKLTEQAQRDKQASDEVYREAMRLTFPDRENFYDTRQEGQSRAQYNWDSTPQVSVKRTADKLSSDFTPAFMDFIEIGLGPVARALTDDQFKELTGKTKEAEKATLEQVTKIVQAILHGPGFASVSHELYIDWQFGQGGMSVMPNPDTRAAPCVFKAMPLGHFYAYEGPNGELDRWFFWHEVRADIIEEQWPDASLPAALEEKAKADKPEKVKLASIVYRDYEEDELRYRYEVIYTKGRNETSRIVERQYRTSPFVTPRQTKLANENRGRGAVTFALPDIRTANKVVELTLRSAAIAVAGVYTVEEDGVQGEVNIQPAALINVRSNGGAGRSPSLARLDTPQRIDFGQIVLEELHFNMRKVLGDTSLPPESDPIRSATEFVRRARELLSEQAAGYGRLVGEFIVPTTQRVVSILEERQLLPTSGLLIDQFVTEVRMKSPLAQAQALQGVEQLVRFIELVTNVGGPAALAYELNMDKVLSWLADAMNIPMELRNTAEQKEQIRAAGAEMVSQQTGLDPAALAEGTPENGATPIQ